MLYLWSFNIKILNYIIYLFVIIFKFLNFGIYLLFNKNKDGNNIFGFIKN